MQNSKWARDITNIEIEFFETREEALEAEKAAIQKEKPLWNVIHNQKQAEDKQETTLKEPAKINKICRDKTKAEAIAAAAQKACDLLCTVIDENHNVYISEVDQRTLNLQFTFREGYKEKFAESLITTNAVYPGGGIALLPSSYSNGTETVVTLVIPENLTENYNVNAEEIADYKLLVDSMRKYSSGPITLYFPSWGELFA
jgi:hypothetical protein